MIREPVVAGIFYPADPDTLRRSIRTYLGKSDKLVDARAVVAPHAGYIYSGRVAGEVYGSVLVPRRIIILGPNHTGAGAPLSLYPEGEWRTPLGAALIDPELTAALMAENPRIRMDRSAHAREHALEVQLPFLQELAPGFRFAALCVGTGELLALQELGHSLARVVKASPDPVLVVASSDMNHYEPADVSEKKDRLAIEKMISVDPAGLHRIVREHEISMCGFAPAVAALTACQDLGAEKGRLIRYAHSGEVSGDYDRVVGYAGMIVT